MPAPAATPLRSSTKRPRAGSRWNGSVTIWDRQLFSTNLESWRSRLCRLAGRNLTTEEWAQFLPGEPYRKTCPGVP